MVEVLLTEERRRRETRSSSLLSRARISCFLVRGYSLLCEKVQTFLGGTIVVGWAFVDEMLI